MIVNRRKATRVHASKAAVHQLTKSLAAALGPHNVA